jgi:aconitate hydratase
LSQVNSFDAKATLTVAGKSHEIYRLDALEKAGVNVQKLPFSLRVLLENLLRNEDGKNITKETILALANWDAKAEPSQEIDFSPSRVILQDFTGVPAVVDLAAMRDAMKALGGDPNKINPLQPVDLVIDHSVQVDYFARPDALSLNSALEFSRNKERYGFLRWGGKSLENFRLVPPATGIVHQVNLEYLAQVVFSKDRPNEQLGQVYPDSVIGTDSHTTMINGLGVLGWGVGGIEAEAAMLGQPVSMLIPHVIGFRLTGALPAGTTATDMVLMVTQQLRKRGVVGKFVEFFGPGVANISVADRATIANMAPEYGATCGIFPIDGETIKFLEQTGRPEELCKLVEAYFREQHMFGIEGVDQAVYTDVLELDLSTVRPSLAGPKRPQDRLDLADAKAEWAKNLAVFKAATGAVKRPAPAPTGEAPTLDLSGLQDGSVVICAITSCTNTSNPSVLMAAGLLAKKAIARGLTRKPWVKTSLAPGSKVVTDYLNASECSEALDALGFNTVGYGCTTCIGNSGPLPVEVSAKIAEEDLTVVSVLSGNRNFEGRVHAEVRANYLASPPLVVAYSLAGTMDFDFEKDSLGKDKDGKDVFLKDLWPSAKEVADAITHAVHRELFQRSYAHVFDGDERWQAIVPPKGDTFEWDAESTYVRHPPYFEGMTKDPKPFADISGARALAVLGDSITTDHISPAGNIKKDSPAGKYLLEKGVAQADFNQYGARRGNHEVMVRGTFANIRLKNALAGGIEGGVTKYLPTGEITSIFEASEKYRADNTPVIVLGGKEYGSGSSRDWAAKGPMLLGIRAVIAESFERIHRSNLVGMGILPLQFKDGDSVASLGLTGEETFTIEGVAAGLASGFANGRLIDVVAKAADGTAKTFQALLRIDTPQERKYVQHGGILQFVLRQLA